MTFEEFKQEIKDDIEYYLAKLTPKEINSDEIADKHTLKLIALFFITGVKLGFKKGLKDEKRLKELKEENNVLREKLKEITDYLENDIPHELINEATNKIWHML